MSIDPVHVVGYLGEAACLSPSARRRIAAADVVVGGARHLDALHVPHERRVVLGPLDPAIATLRSLDPGRAGVVVASGDPGFFGIVRRLRAAGVPLAVEPAPSASAVAFARLGLPWEDAQVVSAHGRDLRRAVNVIRAYPLVAVMTDAGAGIRQIAAALGPWPRRLALLENLGEPNERVRWFSAEAALALDPGDIRQPNVVVAVDPARSTGAGMPWRLGECGAAPSDDGLRSDVVSALVVGALAPGPGDLMAVVGEEAETTAKAAAERGAAVRRLCASGGLSGAAGMPLLDEPDLVCVAATGEHLSEVLDAVAGTWDTVRCLAVVTDDAGVRLAEAFLSRTASDAELVCRRIPVPEPVDLHRVPAPRVPLPGRQLLVAGRRRDE